MKRFVKHDLPEIEQINLPDRRLYQTPEGNRYPSVTTVLSILESPELDEWRLKVGPEEAARIGRIAADSGTKLHEACENYLLGRPTKWTMFDLNAKDMYKLCLPVLERIDVIHAIECRLYSDNLKVAGSVDLIGVLDGDLCIMDWKSSKRYKSKVDIPNYFMQACFYALMFEEQTGVSIPNLKILLVSPEYGLYIHTENTRDWIEKCHVVRKTGLFQLCVSYWFRPIPILRDRLHP